MRFAFFSCQDYTFGYFNAHNLLAKEDVDFVVNLGDYIYAEAYYRPGDAFAGVRTDPIGYSETLDQYRAKYALYRTEAPLRRMHAKFPMISIWDDHEVQDNYAGGAGPTGGLSARAALHARRARPRPTGPTSRACRRSAVKRGSDRIYRAMRFGRTVDLILLDQRQYRADQPCGDPQLGPPCADLEQPRDLPRRRAARLRQAAPALARAPPGRSSPTR